MLLLLQESRAIEKKKNSFANRCHRVKTRLYENANNKHSDKQSEAVINEMEI